MEMLIACLTILGLAFIQNISFSIVSRSRNRDNMKYHVIAASMSNLIWFLTFKQLILTDMSYYVMPFYMVGTVAGSVYGVKISMRIEKWLGATSDGHLKNEKEDKAPSNPKNLCNSCIKQNFCSFHKGESIGYCDSHVIKQDLKA